MQLTPPPGDLLGANRLAKMHGPVASAFSGSRLQARRAALVVVSASAALLLAAQSLWAQGDTTTITIDQETRVVRIGRSTHHEWDTFRLAHGEISVALTGTSSALYSCALGTKVVSDQLSDTLQSYLTLLTPYLSGIVAATRAGIGAQEHIGDVFPSTSTPLQGAIQADSTALVHLDSVVNGSDGIVAVRLLAIGSLDELYTHRFDSQGRVVSDSARRAADTVTVNRFRDSIAALGKRYDWADRHAPPYLAISRGIALALDSLHTAAGPLKRAAPSAGKKSALVKRMLSATDSALSKADALLQASYASEQLAAAVYTNSDTVHCGNLYLGDRGGREIDVTVSAQKVPELSRLATIPDFQLTVTALPKWRMQPALGVSAIYAHAATFPTYVAVRGTDTTTSKNVTVVRNGEQDYRALYGITLGARLPIWKNYIGFSPQFVVSPSSTLRAFGGGFGLTFFNVMSVGIGELVIQNTEYLTPPGTLLTDPSLLQTRTVWTGKWYFSLSLMGWPTGLGSGK